MPARIRGRGGKDHGPAQAAEDAAYRDDRRGLHSALPPRILHRRAQLRHHRGLQPDEGEPQRARRARQRARPRPLHGSLVARQADPGEGRGRALDPRAQRHPRRHHAGDPQGGEGRQAAARRGLREAARAQPRRGPCHGPAGGRRPTRHRLPGEPGVLDGRRARQGDHLAPRRAAHRPALSRARGGRAFRPAHALVLAGREAGAAACSRT